MKQTMTPNLARDDSQDHDDLCRSVQFRSRAQVMESECLLPVLQSSSFDEDYIQRRMELPHTNQDDFYSRRKSDDDHIHLPWGRLVSDRNTLPDLINEEVDEEIEQFMLLPLPETNKTSPYRHKRRHYDDQRSSCLNAGGASPTSKQRTDDCCQSCELQEEVARWFQETFGCRKTDLDSSDFDEKQEQVWNEQWKSLDSMPTPKPLRRQYPFDRENVYPKMLEREALLPPPASRQDCNENQEAFSLQDSDSPLPSVNRFDTRSHGNESSHDSFRNERAAVYTCVECHRLMANNGTELLYCQHCGTLIPIDIFEDQD